MAPNPTTVNAQSLASKSLADILQKVWGRRYCMYGVSLLRISYGMSWLMIAFTNYRDRHYLWGPDGSYSYELFRQTAHLPNFSLYQLSSDHLYFEFVYHAGIIVTLLFIFGTFGRFGAFLQLLFVASLNYRNPIILDGGDNIAFLVLFWLTLADSSAVAARLKRPSSTHMAAGRSTATLLHNVAVAAIIIQLAILYLLSGLYKAQGGPWYEGTAMYYIFQVPEFSWPPLTDLLRGSLVFGLLASYATIFFQISMPALLLSRIGRFCFLIFALLFHGSIALLMGLTSFAAFMLATELVLIKDSEYASCRALLLRARDALVRRGTDVLSTTQ